MVLCSSYAIIALTDYLSGQSPGETPQPRQHEAQRVAPPSHLVNGASHQRTIERPTTKKAWEYSTQDLTDLPSLTLLATTTSPDHCRVVDRCCVYAAEC